MEDLNRHDPLDRFLREHGPSLEVPQDLLVTLRNRIAAADLSRPGHIRSVWGWPWPKFGILTLSASLGIFVVTFGFTVGQTLSHRVEKDKSRIELQILRELNGMPSEEAITTVVQQERPL